MSRARKKARTFGLRAEWIASVWLTWKFYEILARNYSAAGGEIDLIARRGDVIAFVEVKARPTLDEALVAIDAHKARRISRAARAWLAANPKAAGKTLRCDAVLVAPRRLPRHVVAAAALDLFL